MLLEDFPNPRIITPDPRSSHVVVVSAKSTVSLERNIEQLVSYIRENPQTALADLSYTTTARRIQHNLRVAAAGTSLEQIRGGLQSALREPPTAAPAKPSKLAFAFTGQGSYYATLGRDLYRTSSFFRSNIDHYDALSLSHGFPSILPLLDQAADSTQVAPPIQVQLLLVCVQMALCSLWASWGIKPEIVIGHSIGEYAALNVAGVLSLTTSSSLLAVEPYFCKSIELWELTACLQ